MPQTVIARRSKTRPIWRMRTNPARLRCSRTEQEAVRHLSFRKLTVPR
jgi:hypothetical protein